MKKYKIGYTQGVYDMFHVGHLNLLRNAKEQCEYLIVGVNADSLVFEYKNKTPVIDEQARFYIVNNIKCVDEALIVYTLDKKELHDKLKFNAIFIGDDWINSDRWKKTVIEMKEREVDVVFLPHTDNISSTKLRGQNTNALKEENL